MRERITLDGKDPMSRQQAQDATECVGIGVDRRGQVRGRARGLVQHVSDTEVGNDVQTAGERIGPCQIQDGLDRIDLSLDELFVDLHHDVLLSGKGPRRIVTNGRHTAPASVLQCSAMAMGKRTRDRQPAMWVPTTHLPTTSHPFYRRVNELLCEHGFDDFAEGQCAGFYAETMGRPGLPPGIYFRLLLIGYFEGIDSERGIAWRAADSFALREFLGVGLESVTPDHSTISRTRRLIDLETHRAVFTWVLQCLSTAGLVTGKTIGIDATTLEANAALRSIVRRDSV